MPVIYPRDHSRNPNAIPALTLNLSTCATLNLITCATRSGSRRGSVEVGLTKPGTCNIGS